MDPTARREEPDSFKNVVPSANVKMALLTGVPVHVQVHVPVPVQVHVPVHVQVPVLNRSNGIRRNGPK